MTKRTMIRLPPDLYEELRILAETHDRSQAQEIVSGLKFYARTIKKREAQYGRRYGNEHETVQDHGAGFDTRAP